MLKLGRESPLLWVAGEKSEVAEFQGIGRAGQTYTVITPNSSPSKGPNQALNKRGDSHSLRITVPGDEQWRGYLHRGPGHRWGFPGGSVGKESVCQCRRCRRKGFDPPVGKIPWSRKWQHAPIFLPGRFCGQRSLTGYSPWGHKE